MSPACICMDVCVCMSEISSFVGHRSRGARVARRPVAQLPANGVHGPLHGGSSDGVSCVALRCCIRCCSGDVLHYALQW